MKSLLELWNVALVDLGSRCGAESTAHDFSTVVKRVEQEGVSFLTITLPTFSKDLERALEIGYASSALFTRWKRSSRAVTCSCHADKERNGDGSLLMGASPLPLFLRGFMEKVFCPATGLLLDQPDTESIFAIRQLTLMYAKILLPCSDARRRAAFKLFVECEKEIRAADAGMTTAEMQEFKQASTVLWSTVLTQVDEDVYYGRIVPKHGPGATADRLRGNTKWDLVEWTARLEHIFPFMENVLANGDRYYSSLDRVEFLEPGSERPVRVVDVPKTLKTPRLIAIEPTCMQYMQQGLWRKFHEYLENRKIGRFGIDNVGFGVVNFTSQEFNRSYARLGSLDGRYATLDLSEASDRVSNQLVRSMLGPWPWLAEAVDACRSRSADVEGHGVIRLAKFASMGSALTFPMEAMIFSSIVFVGIARELNEPVSTTLVKKWKDEVLVYGDDIIVPARFAQSVMDALEAFGLKVNPNKSFWKGKFRESCGAEYYAGDSCSVTRIRRMIPTSRTEAEEVVSLVSSRNQFYASGMWQTASYLDEKIRTLLKGNYPIVEETSPVLGRHSVCFGYEPEKMDKDYHSPLVKGYVVSAKPPVSKLEGLGALAKCLIKDPAINRNPRSLDALENLPDSRIEHLQFSGRPDAVHIKLRFASPF